ncbi:VOC family protein [Paractinoplanes globisporus]|uniref:VOC family protein n=1 Tax=Paractinoplanes globisporus TaxID=113565 RepID=A0ABW6WIX8_9ACTN|nr:VOC family protein [Actinoplanes globisporus]
MANQTGRPVAPARKLVAAVMGTIAVFVVALGLGMSSWGVALFGLAVLVLSIALGMVNVVRRGARAWVTGTAEVKAISPPPTSSAVFGRAEIQAVIVAPGLPTSEVTIREPRIPVVKWPMPGDTLPITVDVDDMRRVKINWDDASPRNRGQDPPPPRTTDYGDLPDEVDEEIDDDLLGDVDPPPWVARDRQWDDEPDEEEPPAPEGPPVVVRDTPAGPVVEGEFVDHDEAPQTLPRRAAAGAAAAGAAAGAAAAAGPAAGAAAEPDAAAAEPDAAAAAAGPGAAAGAAAGPAAGLGADAGAGAGVGAAAGHGAAAGAAAGFGAAGAGGGPGAGTESRPAGRRPSPRPRGGGTATATAEPIVDETQATAPPQRAPHPDDVLGDEDLPAEDLPVEPLDDELLDVPLDEPGPYRRPEPTATATTAAPEPVTTFPTAPDPVSPPPTAPEPSTRRPSAPPAAGYDDIDLPLDADAEPESMSPGAAEAMDEGLIAPPVEEEPSPPVEVPSVSAEVPPVAAGTPRGPESRPTTRFMSNAAHDAEASPPSGAAAGEMPAAPEEKHTSPGVMAGAAAAAGAMAAGVVAAMKKFGHSEKGEPEAPASAAPTGPAPTGPAPAGPAPTGPAPTGPAQTQPLPTEPAPAAASSPGPAEPAPAAGGAAASGMPDENPWAAPPPVSVEPDEHADELITAYPSARPGAAGAIYGVGITVLVTDLERSVTFYRDTLGFYEIDRGDGSAVLASGDTRLVLRTVSGLSSEAGRLIFLNLEVGDVEAVYAELKEKGVTFVHPPQPVNRGDRLELWSATFRDPDDHNIAITQWRAIR